MKKIIFAVMLLIIMIVLHGTVPAKPPTARLVDYTAYPPFMTESVPPLVMLALSRDHKLYYEAYNDASDLDEDGQLDVSYTHSIDYYGYFDSYKCYTYDTSGQAKFIISSITTDKYCGGSEWSGNFLNWLSMSRMDVIRKVLYGGYRSADNVGQNYETVLEGVYIPQDAHSWGKEYNGSDTSQLTPFSNPSPNRHLFCMTSLGDGDPHIIRVLQNKSQRVWEWASKERPVCDTSLGTPTDYIVRVEVCDRDFVGTTGGLEENCKQYKDTGGDATYKPVGLLQKYGEGAQKVCSKSFNSCNNDNDCDTASGERCVDNASMYFGLITGSYTKNLSGGVLRKNIWPINDEINPNNGFIQSGGIIDTIDTMRIIEFGYPPSYWYYYNDNCGWITTRGLNEGECRVWGNPIGEIMYESVRYFANKGAPTSDYTYSTSNDRSLQLPKPDWDRPYDIYPYCSKPAIIAFSDVSPSYDSDQVPGSYFSSFSGDLTGLNVSTLAGTIGSNEGISGTDRFIGESGSTYDFICSAKYVSDLSQIRSLCPEDPTKEGSYYSASIGYYGNTFFSDNNDVDGDSNTATPDITTYSVALSSPVPEIRIKVGDNYVTMVPTGKSVSGCLSVNTACAQKCTLTYDSNTGLLISSCASDSYCPSNQIVDFYVDTVTYDGNNNVTYAKFRINFEDVEQGADHDMDAIVEYEICTGTSCSPAIASDEVKVSLDSSVYAAGCIDQVLGFIISGVGADDRLYLTVKDDDVPPGASGDTPAVVGNMPKTWTKTFTVSSSGSTATLITNPLWYAAKWGGFKDTNTNDLPDLSSEWDNDGDGVPDNYFLVVNPLELETQLNSALADILSRAGSGTAASILATTGEGEGASYQAYFFSTKRDVLGIGTEVKWLGFLHSLFLDSYGNLREDTDSDRILDICANDCCTNDPPTCSSEDDRIVKITYDTTNGTRVSLYSDDNGNGLPDDSGTDFREVATGIPIENVSPYIQTNNWHPLWNAGYKLWERTAGSRVIYTSINGTDIFDIANLSVYDSTDSFVDTNKSTLRKYLRANTDNQARNIIRYIRGENLSWRRSRGITAYDPSSGGNVQNVWKLGDIVYSTPTAVAKPAENYDLIYADSSYTAFRQQYTNRRQVVYTGANDGMLHAFNGGFYDEATRKFWKGYSAGVFNDSGPELGEELWAFIPRELLPHLQWLWRLRYTHVYYVDLKPKVTDVKIFCLDPDSPSVCINGQSGVSHPGGWGTILIGGMRLGGKEIPTESGIGDFSPSYFALDITDPETPPKLLWTFRDINNLGQTSSYPAVARILDTSTGTDKWFMIVGSGPTAFDTYSNVSSDQRGYVFIVDLKTGSLSRSIQTPDNKAFMADPITVDVSLDYKIDVAYIGETYDLGNNWYGKMFRLTTKNDTDPANWELSTLVSPSGNKPVTAAPSAALDNRGNMWVFFGTGKFWGTIDKGNTDIQSFYGVKDTCKPWLDYACTSTMSDFLDVSSGVVTIGGGTVTGVSGVTDWGTLLGAVNAKDGWVINFPSVPGHSTIDGERSLNKPLVLGGLVVFATYIPETGDICSAEGESYIYAPFYGTGTAYKDYVFKDEITSQPSTVGRVKYLGAGLPSGVSAAITRGGALKGFVQQSTGAIIEIEQITPYALKSGVNTWRTECQ